MQNRDTFELGSLEPYPEQINTRMAEAATGFHAAPVEIDREFLIHEGYSEKKIAVVCGEALQILQLSAPRLRRRLTKYTTSFCSHRNFLFRVQISL